MQRVFLKLAGLLLMGAASAVLPPTLCAQGKQERLGRVAVDEYEATIDFQDCRKEQYIYRVTLSLRKPRKAPGIQGNRIEVWLLETTGGSRAAPFVQRPANEVFAEEGEGEQVTAKAVYCFESRVMPEYLVAVVVAVDGEPTVFRLQPPPSARRDAKVIAAWKKAGATFHYDEHTQLSGFYIDGLKLPLARELPMPTMPFGLFTQLGTAVEPGMLSQLPGRTQARVLQLTAASLSNADRKELANLKQLRTLIMSTSNSDEWADWNLKAVGSLPQLEELELRGGTVSETGLKQLAGLKRLRTLDLSFNTPVTDEGVKVLAALPQLRALHLRCTKITDVGLKQLVGLQQLETLSLGDTVISDAGLKEVAHLKQLRVLSLRSTKITGVGLKELADCAHLQSLDLYDCPLSDVDCQELAHLRQLQVLNLDSTKVGDKGLRALAGLRELRTLNLRGTKISGAGLKELTGLKELRSLKLSETELSDAGMKQLAGLKELRFLNLYDIRGISDDGLRELASLKQLQRLIFFPGSTKVTGNGITELRKALPWACIAP